MLPRSRGARMHPGAPQPIGHLTPTGRFGTGTAGFGKPHGLRLSSPGFRAITARSHIIGLAFMRAKGMGELANLFPADDPRVPVLRRLAAIQVEKGFKVIGAVGYAGSHYCATFATLYLLTNER